MSRRAVDRCAVLLFAAVSSVSAPAFAGDGASSAKPADVSRADALFEEGRALMRDGDFTSACARFEESNAIDTSAGTLLNWGRCLEQLGKTSSALLRYREAERLGRQRAQTRHIEAAKVLITAIEPKLSKLTITARDVPGLRVTRDGVVVALGEPTPVDPGKHVVEATAPGYEPFWTTLEMQAGPTTRKLEVPELTRSVAGPSAPPEVTPPPPPPREGEWNTGMLAGGIAISAAGVGGLVVGTVLGVGVLSSASEAETNRTLCPRKACSAAGLAYIDQAADLATASTISLVAGGVLAVAGIPLIVVAAPSSGQPSLSLSTLPGATGLLLTGGF